MEASNPDSSLEWDMVDGLVLGRLNTPTLPKGWLGHFSLLHCNEHINRNCETIYWNVVSVPLPVSSTPSLVESGEGQSVIFGAFAQHGRVAHMWGHRTEATVTAEVSGTLRPSIVYRLSVGFYGGFAIVHHSFAEISDLLKIPQETVIDWLTTAFPYLLEHDFDADFSLPLGSLQEEGWDETVRYRNAMQKLAHSGGKILEAFALLDRLTPRYECDIRGFWKSLRRKIGRLHGTVRAKGFAPVYEAFCTQNENTLAEEAARQIDAMSWIAESVLFTKCQLYDRLHGIDYCIDAGHPLEAEFCLLKPTHAGNSWHSPTFFIEVIDYSSPHDDPEHALTLSTSWSFDESSSDTQADKCLTKICKISPKAQSLSPDAMCVDKTFLHALWRYSRVTSKMID